MSKLKAKIDSLRYVDNGFFFLKNQSSKNKLALVQKINSRRGDKISLKEKEDKMKQNEKKQFNIEDWKDQQACSYAALICFDVGVEINEENINRLLQKANLQVKKYWPELFCKLIRSKGLTELIANSVNACVSSGNVSSQLGTKDCGTEKKISKKEEKKSITEESSASAAAFFDGTDSDDDSDSVSS